MTNPYPASAEQGRFRGLSQNRPAAQEQGEGAKPEGANPKPEGAQAKPDGSNPRLEGSNPKPEGAQQKPEGANPQPEGATAKPEAANSKPAEGAAAKPEIANPQSEGGTQKPEAAGPKPEDASSKPEGANPKPEVANSKPEDANPKPEDATTKPDGSSTSPAAAKPSFELAAPIGDLDPKKPTVAFLDNFTKDWPAASLDGDNPNGKISHGEFSAMSAEQNGFNAVRLELTTDRAKDIDFAKTLDDVGKAIDDGKLPLGKGDVLNISAGNNDPTFDEASKTLGFKVTPENLKEMRPKILERLGELANDPSQSDKDRERFKRVVDTNAAIDRMQARGVEVMQSAGNEGPTKFSWDFMNAKHQLSAVTPDGTPEKFSANHSLATPTQANFDTHYNKYDLTSPQPLAEQNGPGTYKIGDEKYSAAKFGGERTSRHFVERNEDGIVVNGRQPAIPTDVAFNPSSKNTPEVMQPHTPAKLETVKAVPERPEFTKKPSTLTSHADPFKGIYVENSPGTSFANKTELPKHLERLTKIKAGLA